MTKTQYSLLIIAAMASASGLVVAKSGGANLHQIDHSKVKAMITFSANSGSISADGVATGLEPNATYVSVLYDNGSAPGGPKACSSTSMGPAPVVIGYWNVDQQGTGNLQASVSDVEPSEFGTVSIRTAANPERKFLRACGKVHIN